MKINPIFIITIILLSLTACGKKETPICKSDFAINIVRITFYTTNLKKEFIKFLELPDKYKKDSIEIDFSVYHYQNLNKSCDNFKNNFVNEPTCRMHAIYNNQVSNDIIDIHPSHVISNCQVTIDQYEQHFINHNIDYNTNYDF